MILNSGKSHNGGQKALMGRCVFYLTDLVNNMNLMDTEAMKQFQLLS